MTYFAAPQPSWMDLFEIGPVKLLCVREEPRKHNRDPLCGREGTGNPPLASRFDADFVVHGESQLLFAATIDFSGLDRYMSEEKLDLVKILSGQTTQTRAGASHIVGR